MRALQIFRELSREDSKDVGVMIMFRRAPGASQIASYMWKELEEGLYTGVDE